MSPEVGYVSEGLMELAGNMMKKLNFVDLIPLITKD